MPASSRYFVFLRAINTGERRLSNEQLAAPFVEAGFIDVAAYQAAGNITFRCADDSMITEPGLDALVATAYGFAAPVFVRTASDLAEIVETTPFGAAQLSRTEGRVQLTFLREWPDDRTVAAATELVPDEDAVVFAGREWFWLPQAGVSTSALPVAALEQVLGPMTMRTLGTVRRMLAKFGE